MQPLEYFNVHKKDFFDQLREFISFKSISTDPAFKKNILDTSAWLEMKLKDLGFEVKIAKKENSNPFILARLDTDPSYTRVLIYGHYDVQPVEPIEDWITDPFTMTEKDGKFFARGVMDNKGQISMHLTSLASYIKSGTPLPINIRLIIEGGEESGSPDIEKIIEENKDFLEADIALISDGPVKGEDTPLIESSFRGIIDCELTIFGPHEDMHAGEYGGAIPNPCHELAKLLTKLYNEDFSVAVPHFYDDVDKISKEEHELAAQINSDEDVLTLSGSKKILGEKGFLSSELTGLRPTIQVTALNAGYTGIGIKNIVPAKATAKFNIRLVEHQKPEMIYEYFKKFIETNIPEYVTYSLSECNGVAPVKISLNNKYIKKTRQILTDVFEHEPYIRNVGGTLPIVFAIKTVLHIPILCIPLSQEDSGMHAPNERLLIKAFERGVTFSIAFIERIAK